MQPHVGFTSKSLNDVPVLSGKRFPTEEFERIKALY
jgi:hypothetical protein